MSKIQVNEIVNHFDNGAPDCPRGLTVTGVSTFSGSVSIGGTLSYEDVTNIDSVGIITAQSGIHVTGGSVGIGTDNPSDHLQILHTNGKGLTFKTTENNYAQITSDCNRTDADSHLLAIEGHWNGTPVAEIALITGTDNTNKDDGQIIFRTSSANNLNSNERLRILSSGGITFNGDTAAANALDDYEEGTITDWRLAKTGSTTGSNDSTAEIQYTKIGRCVYISGYIYTANTGSASGAVVAIVKTSDNTTKATLPFVPNHIGALPVSHTRSMTETHTTYGLSVGFVANNAGVYLYSNNGTGNYVVDENNVSTNAQTHLVITFGGHYFTDS